MARDYPRSYRVADQIQREISQLIRLELKDPRISDLLTISSVDVTRDLSLAKIYFTVLKENQQKDTETGLKQSAGYLRKLLGRRLTMRSVPELRFVYDTTIEEGVRMTGLIDQAIKTNTTVGEDG